MKNIYKIHVRCYSLSPADCNKLVPHWDEKYTSMQRFKLRAKEITNEIRLKRNIHCTCWVEVFKNGEYIGEYTIRR